MNRAVVHDDNRFGSRERLHFEDEIRNERSEEIAVERALDDHTLNDPVIERDRRQNRVPIFMSKHSKRVEIEEQYLLPRAKYCFLHARRPSKAHARFRR